MVQMGTDPPVPFRYHSDMAMNLRLPDELDAQLDELAAAEHTSKSALVLRGVKMVLESAHRQAAREQTLAAVLAEDASLLRRLADA
ncbi:Ribbon-helix-helix protein, copG family [Micrococcus terreus]|uniref:Ribbon-helix-helix protein, copG family n=2 Tax=Micrococcaceae TaxID=1268 RepID=A0A1I7MIU3_9MICC|nr:Ribbon-helix-helix protein, copG family [Micrococcus terreus]